MGSTARKTQLPVSHQISRTINYNDAGVATGVYIGTVPLGSLLGTTKVVTSVAFNGTVSVALSVGSTLTGTQFINGTDVRTAIARVDTVVPAAAAGPLATDVDVYASIAFGGTVGTAGVATVELSYNPNIG